MDGSRPATLSIDIYIYFSIFIAGSNTSAEKDEVFV